MNALKKPIKAILRRLGYQIRRLPPDDPAPKRNLINWLATRGDVATLIDIGAHDGTFAAYLARKLQPRATFAFEPLPQLQNALRRKGKVIRNLDVFPVALLDRAGSTTMYLNNNLPTSSFLPVSAIQKREFPETVGESPITIETACLDDLLKPRDLDREIFIKVDVQGVEREVMRGGRRVFEAAKYVLIEVSFAVMHENQPVFEEVHADLADLGFRFTGLRNQINSKATGQPLFGHALYVRPD